MHIAQIDSWPQTCSRNAHYQSAEGRTTATLTTQSMWGLTATERGGLTTNRMIDVQSYSG
jgi:hypothetical protein